MPGPIPERSDQRRRRNKSEIPIVKAPTAQSVAPQAPEADEHWHPMARDWYASLSQSGQSTFYEASDWQTARVWAEVLSRQLRQDRLSAQMIAAWASAAAELLTTEGSRRRGRLELERPQVDEDELASVTALDSYAANLTA